MAAPTETTLENDDEEPAAIVGTLAVPGAPIALYSMEMERACMSQAPHSHRVLRSSIQRPLASCA